MDTVASAASQTLAIQNAFQVVSLLQLTASLFPPQANVSDNSTYDCIIVGGGTAGLVIANGLTEVKNLSVLVIEAGDDPPLEAMLLGLFTYLPNTRVDWNFTSTDDGFTARELKNNVVSLLQGRLLGGSSSSGHGINIRGNPIDYKHWAKAANDSSWDWDGLYKYFLAMEKLKDPAILNSADRQYHGTEGNTIVIREPHKELIPYLQSFAEIGYKTVLDINKNDTLGYTQPLFTNYGFRQSTAFSYLTPIKNRPNLHVLRNTFVSKILFKKNTAIGVEAITESNDTITINARKEIIVTAGAFNTPKLLLLSGIGPKAHLRSLGIKVVKDLPVGKNLQDHLMVMLVHIMDESDATTPASDPTKFPVPCFIGHVALNKSQTLPDYQVIGLFIPHDSAASLAICTNLFSYKDEICAAVYEASEGRNIVLSLLNKLHPKSRGQVLLNTTNPLDDPIINLGTYTDMNDHTNMTAYVLDHLRVMNTTYFQNVSAEMVDFDLSECSNFTFGSTEYWDCYTLEMTATVYHYAGTCSLGSVVDASLKVFGVKNLRVADASVIPYVNSGNIEVAVKTVAFKAVDIIKKDNGWM